MVKKAQMNENLLEAYSPLIELFYSTLEQSLLALEAVIPFCNKIDIFVDEQKAYDEWEMLVQQFFDSFVILAITDGDTMAPARYKKLGFGFELDKMQSVITAEMDKKTFYLEDIISEDGIKMTTEWVPLVDGKPDYPNRIRLKEFTQLINFKAIELFYRSDGTFGLALLKHRQLTGPDSGE